MVPLIGLAATAYILLRCTKMLVNAGSRYSSKLARSTVMVCALLTCVGTGFFCFELVRTALGTSSVSAAVRNMLQR